MSITHWADFCFRSRLACAYQIAKRYVLNAGFHDEIEWQSKRELSDISEEGFLREAAWVIFSSGMRESVIRTRFKGLDSAFLNFRSASRIISKRSICRRQALKQFNHRGKVDAVLEIAKHVSNSGFQPVRDGLQTKPVEYLSQFPYLGPATARHLAKNLGVRIAKPDRHLQRISSLFGYESPEVMCAAIATMVPDDVSVIDVVIWRFATIDHNYLDFFRLAFAEDAFSLRAKC